MIHLYRLLIRTYLRALIYLLGTLDGCDPVMQPMNFAKELDRYINDVREGDNDQDAPLFTDRSGETLTGNAVRKLFDRLKVSTGIDDLCAHMLRHTWATNYHRSASGGRFDLQAEGGWRTGRMVERYTKSRPFEERRRGPSPLTAFREATKGKRPEGKRPPQQGSGLSVTRTA